jgi:hypothetical protein
VIRHEAAVPFIQLRLALVTQLLASGVAALGEARWRPAPVPAFPCETMNIPTVMTPWGMNSHFGLLFARSPAASQRDARAADLDALRVDVAGPWVAHGEDSKAVRTSALRVVTILQQLRLNNGLPGSARR